MPHYDDDGDRVEQGNKRLEERTVSVTDSATVTISGLTNITDILGTQTEGEASVDETNDCAADAVQGTADNEVDVTLYTGGGVDTLDTTANQTGQTRSVTVVVKGY